jgi:hypothetical protein
MEIVTSRSAVSRRRIDALALSLVFGAALTFYSLTLAPTVIWSDSASLSWRASTANFRFGTAADHPVYLMVGWVLSRLPGEVARNVNFASALFGALAVMLVYRCARQLGASPVASCAGAAALAVSHAFWLHSVIAEVYTANAFFLAASVSLLLEWRRRRRWPWLVLAALVFAVGLANHLVLFTAAPAAVVFVLLTTGKSLFSRRMLVTVGVAVAVALVIVIVPPSSISAAFWRMWYGPPGIYEYLGLNFAPAATVKEGIYYLLFLAYQFPSVSLVFALAGAVALWRADRGAAALLLLTIAVNAAVFVRHTVWSSAGGTKYVFYIADYTVFAILCAIGAHKFLQWIANRGFDSRQRLAAAAVLVAIAVAPPLIYAAMPSVSKRAGVNLVPARDLAYRDNVRFFLNPNKRGEDGAKRFAENAFAVAAPGAVIFADHTPYAVLRYMQITQGQRPDVLVPSLGGAQVRVRWMYQEDGHRRPIYLASKPLPGYYDLTALTGHYQLVPVGPLFEVRPRETAEPGHEGPSRSEPAAGRRE